MAYHMNVYLESKKIRICKIYSNAPLLLTSLFNESVHFLALGIHKNMLKTL